MRVDLHWGHGCGQPFAYDNSLTVAAVVADLVALLRAEGYGWSEPPERTALFRHLAGAFQPLSPAVTLAAIGLDEGEPLYLATLDAPWMMLAGAVPEPTPVTGPAPAYRLTLAEGCTADVSTDQTPLCRAFLLDRLRAAGVPFDEQDMRLRRVSRERHCDLLRDGAAWFLLPTGTTYLDGRRLPNGQAAPLPGAPATVLLGTDGWPIVIERI